MRCKDQWTDHHTMYMENVGLVTSWLDNSLPLQKSCITDGTFRTSFKAFCFICKQDMWFEFIMLTISITWLRKTFVSLASRTKLVITSVFQWFCYSLWSAIVFGQEIPALGCVFLVKCRCHGLRQELVRLTFQLNFTIQVIFKSLNMGACFIHQLN